MFVFSTYFQFGATTFQSIAIAGVLLLSFPSVAAGSQRSLTEEGLYRRCLIHLTGLPVPLKDPRGELVKKGELSAVQACTQVLELGALGLDGRLQKPNDKQGRAVLKTMFSFHRSWFQANTIEQIHGYSEETGFRSSDLYDPGEPALTLTRTLLSDNSYRDVLTSETGVRALREENLAVRARLGYTDSSPSRRIFGNDQVRGPNFVTFQPSNFPMDASETLEKHRGPADLSSMPMIEVGELIGIRVTKESFQVPNVHLEPYGNIARRGNLEPGLNYQYDFFKPLAPGILGQPVFFMMNYGHGRGLKSNGASKLPRRWIQAGLESFLCSALPSLREADVVQHLKVNSLTAFRQATSCLRCHSTLDQMATTGRNFVTGGSTWQAITSTQPSAYTNASRPLIVTSYQQTQVAGTYWSDSAVPNFHLQKPTGKIFMRTLRGELIDHNVNDVRELSVFLSGMDDFYTCAAKRYFEYFTGIHIPLYDRTDPGNENLNKALTADAIKLRATVENLGASLKKHQSLKELIKEIIGSEVYRTRSF